MALPSENRQAGAETEATPEMIAAGEAAIYDLGIDALSAGDITPREVSACVFSAMVRARS